MTKEHNRVESDTAEVLERSTDLNEQREIAVDILTSLVTEDNEHKAEFEAKMQSYLEVIERQRALESKFVTALYTTIITTFVTVLYIDDHNNHITVLVCSIICCLLSNTC